MTSKIYPGQRVWVPHEEQAWAKAVVLEVDKKILTVKVEDRFETVLKIDPAKVENINEESNSKEYFVEDLTKLPDLHQPAILETLDVRFKNNYIYTYSGHILIAINPFKDIDGLYGREVMNKFIRLDLGDKYPPHAYSLAHLAFLNMINNTGQNQSILVSGESGAGKTVTTKLVMDYLTAVSQSRSGRDDDHSRKVCNRVLNTNPLLESFGNAATLRNDNSSRFGKLIHLQFQPGHSALIGAKLDTYLLEKARIRFQQQGERNFHIFYELAAGLPESDKKSWFMPKIDDCNYLNQSDRRNRHDINDAEQFKVTMSAMQAVGFTEEEKNKICKTIIAILHLGNIEFEETFENKEEGSKISPASKHAAESCCKLLSVNINILERALCSRSIIVGNLSANALEKPLTVTQAIESRDALATAIYERMFLWIVWRVNQSISVVRDSAAKRLSEDLKKLNQKKGKVGVSYYSDYSISCLDIFGFEVFEKNGFEQMCINYANEVLQSIFNEFVFTLEQKYYEQEGIDWTKIEYPDNHACIEMIEGSPIGLLKLIDEECLYPRGNDDSLHMKLVTNMEKRYSSFTVSSTTQRDHNLFSILHFAGKVEYDVHGFHAKNKNELRQEAVDLIRSSQDDLIKMLLPPTAEEASGANSIDDYFDKVFAGADSSQKGNKRQMRSSIERNRRAGTTKLQQRTVGAHFKDQLGEAMAHIRASKPHFVRCIKPNDRNVSEELNRPRTLEQLNYSGVLEAVRIARAGYTSRFQLKEFLKRFYCLNRTKTQGNDKKECIAILEKAQLKLYEDYQVGHTRVFLRAEAFARLESLKREVLHDSVLLIQKTVKKWLFRKYIRERIEEKREAERKRLEEERLRQENEQKLRASQGGAVIHEVTPPVPPPRKTKADRKHGTYRTRGARRGKMAQGDDDLSEGHSLDRSIEYAEEEDRHAKGVKEAEDLDFVAAIEPIVNLMKANFDALVQGKDVNPQVIVVVGPAVILIVALMISPTVFVNMLALGGIGFGVALQFRKQKLKEQKKKKKRRAER